MSGEHGMVVVQDWGGGCSLLNSTTGLPQNCSGNGQVELPFGSREYLVSPSHSLHCLACPNWLPFIVLMCILLHKIEPTLGFCRMQFEQHAVYVLAMTASGSASLLYLDYVCLCRAWVDWHSSLSSCWRPLDRHLLETLQ